MSQTQWAAPMHTQGEMGENRAKASEIRRSLGLPLCKVPGHAWLPEEQHLGGGPGGALMIELRPQKEISRERSACATIHILPSPLSKSECQPHVEQGSQAGLYGAVQDAAGASLPC